jgi:hypothetical protein
MLLDGWVVTTTHQPALPFLVNIMGDTPSASLSPHLPAPLPISVVPLQVGSARLGLHNKRFRNHTCVGLKQKSGFIFIFDCKKCLSTNDFISDSPTKASPQNIQK